MHLKRLTLVFSDVRSHLEPAFHDYYFRHTLNQIKIAVFAAFLFYGLFGFLDSVVMPDRFSGFWVIRWAIVCPCLLAVFLFCFTQYALRYLQPVVSFGAMVCGLGFIAMIQMASDDQTYLYIAGLVQTLFFMFTFARLRFIWAAGVASFLVVAYPAVTIALGHTHRSLVIGNGLYLAVICLMGMMAGYVIEYRTRKNFFLSRHLETKKRRLVIANEFLEERVAKRTSELKRTNTLLRNEINERKMIESALRDSQKRYRRMVNKVSDYMCVYELSGRILESNRQMAAGLGYSFEELADMNYQDLILPEERATYFQYLIDIRRQGRAVGSLTLMTKEGEPRLFEYSNVLAEHTTGHQAIFSLARDITDRKRAEKALAESRARFQNIFETAAAGMAIIDAQTQCVVEINSAAAKMAGDSINRLKGRHLNQLLQNEDTTETHQLPMPTPYPMECLLNTAAGTPLPILTSTQITEFEDHPHWILSFVNIQKIKEAEAAKRELEIRSNRAQHLEAIGTLAGGIAHDFNNILFGIMGFAELALEDAPEESIQANNLKEIINGGHRAKEMIYQILTFSRQDSVEKKPILPTPLIKEALKLLRASLPASIEIKTRFASQINRIMANPTHVHQLVMNLCTNAAHAVGANEGLIEIRAANKRLDEDRQTPHGKLPKGDYVRLCVSDNGDGIPPEVIDRIYEPFFTTKAQGLGSGMGLSVVLGIVQAHQGSIHVFSHPGKGTSFEVLFPAVQAADPSNASPMVVHPRGTERILVVDDEEKICIVADRMLTGLGYHVTTCGHPSEALALFKGQPHDWDLVLTDLTMPKMTGTKLIQELLSIRPDTPIILCTGYGEQIARNHLHALGIREFLHKPMMKGELSAAIRRALDAN